MCLTIKEKYSEPQIATEDISCYKVILDNRDHKLTFYDDEGLFTPFLKEQIEIGSTYTSEFSFTGAGNIEMALHSLINLDDCHTLIMRLLNSQHLIICSCLIPKGSRYYQGNFSGHDSYASDKLTYLEILT